MISLRIRSKHTECLSRLEGLMPDRDTRFNIIFPQIWYNLHNDYSILSFLTHFFALNVGKISAVKVPRVYNTHTPNDNVYCKYMSSRFAGITCPKEKLLYSEIKTKRVRPQWLPYYKVSVSKVVRITVIRFSGLPNLRLHNVNLA